MEQLNLFFLTLVTSIPRPIDVPDNYVSLFVTRWDGKHCGIFWVDREFVDATF